MKRTIDLRFFKDDANGEWGLAHFNSIDIDTPFNAFWSGEGMLHDVFDHYFEGIHPYFSGKYAFNLAGEIAAMGHALAYGNRGMRRMRFGQLRSGFEHSVIGVTHSDMYEAIKHGYSNYGDELLCKVPHQSHVDYHSDCYISEHAYMLEDAKKEVGRGCHDDQERAWCRRYAKSCTESKLGRLYRWGYKQGQKICPNWECGLVLNEFTDYWNTFCKENNAEQMANYYRGVLVTTNTVKGVLTWDAHFIPKFVRDTKVNHKEAADWMETEEANMYY